VVAPAPAGEANKDGGHGPRRLSPGFHIGGLESNDTDPSVTVTLPAEE